MFCRIPTTRIRLRDFGLAELRLILFATIGVTIMFIVRNHSVPYVKSISESILSLLCYSKEIEHLKSAYLLCTTSILFRPFTQKSIRTPVSIYKKESCFDMELDSTLQTKKDTSE